MDEVSMGGFVVHEQTFNFQNEPLHQHSTAHSMHLTILKGLCMRTKVMYAWITHSSIRLKIACHFLWYQRNSIFFSLSASVSLASSIGIFFSFVWRCFLFSFLFLLLLLNLGLKMFNVPPEQLQSLCNIQHKYQFGVYRRVYF